jgi:hypothetical protein
LTVLLQRNVATPPCRDAETTAARAKHPALNLTAAYDELAERAEETLDTAKTGPAREILKV